MSKLAITNNNTSNLKFLSLNVLNYTVFCTDSSYGIVYTYNDRLSQIILIRLCCQLSYIKSMALICKSIVWLDHDNIWHGSLYHGSYRLIDIRDVSGVGSTQ